LIRPSRLQEKGKGTLWRTSPSALRILGLRIWAESYEKGQVAVSMECWVGWEELKVMVAASGFEPLTKGL
jgi:hypothetical protein